jgi:hypothetical protein
MKKISRRAALFSAGLLSLLGPTRAEAADLELIGLGRQFDAVAAKLDRAIEHGLNIDWSDLKEFGRIVDEIVAMPATTIEGLCVKARVRCWARLGDLDDHGEQSTDEDRMALSIVRDLIRLRHPDLERPGALTQLVREIEEPAVRSSTHEAG